MVGIILKNQSDNFGSLFKLLKRLFFIGLIVTQNNICIKNWNSNIIINSNGILIFQNKKAKRNSNL